MQRSISSLAFAVAIVALAIFTHSSFSNSQAQSVSTSSHLITSNLPPPPDEIVNLNWLNFSPQSQSGIPLAMGASLSIYTVPVDRWFLLTDGSPAGGCAIIERVGPIDRIKASQLVAGVPFSDMKTPLAFAPGSEVVLANPGPSTVTLQFSWSGYLTPLHGQAVVNVDSGNFGGGLGGSVPLTNGATLTVFTVPLNKWLVLTDPVISGGNFFESLGGAITFKGGDTIGPVHFAIGVTFAPGSDVVIQNPYSGTVNLSFHLRGYLADP